ncbi:branched-chain amino acid transporter permease [Helicobacter bizzozeronii]|uniref:branched-chain amino acid transporter permease n=1 Tax=Helicobacter bizzozeronii TaxID=56877 RepID=UPI000CF0B403|nr:AzlD domain-containing protein [Helicobacter bizzozeronii]
MLGLYILMAWVITALTTYAFKVFSFLIFNAKRKAPSWVLYLGRMFGSGAVGMLIIYGIKDGSFGAPPYGLNEILAIVSVAIVHGLLRVFIISVAVGTALYMFLVQSAILEKLF